MFIIDSVGKIVSNCKKNQYEIKEKLDPITILVTWALMKYSQPNSRLTYDKSLRVWIQEPKAYGSELVMSAVRTFHGQSREDMSIISPAIDKAAAWHPPHLEENQKYKTLFVHVMNGFDSPITTYEKQDSQLTVSGLKDWKSSISKLISGKIEKIEIDNEKEIDHKLEKIDIENENEVEQNKKSAEEHSKIEKHRVLQDKINKVKALWEENNIEVINILFNTMEKKQEENRNCDDEIRQVKSMLELKHKKLVEIWKDQ